MGAPLQLCVSLLQLGHGGQRGGLPLQAGQKRSRLLTCRLCCCLQLALPSLGCCRCLCCTCMQIREASSIRPASDLPPGYPPGQCCALLMKFTSLICTCLLHLDQQ